MSGWKELWRCSTQRCALTFLRGHGHTNTIFLDQHLDGDWFVRVDDSTQDLVDVKA